MATATRTYPISTGAPLRVDLAGCGVVGSALVRALEHGGDALRERHGLRVSVGRVLVREPEKRRDVALDPSVFTRDVSTFLQSNADLVVEAIGGLEPALTIARAPLERGATLVTANKALLATHGSELAALALRHGASLRYDAAVGGGVPVLRLIQNALGAGTPSRVRGIFNGTTNFVLSRLEDGWTLDAALTEARSRGFAEADASRDLDGRDAADKITLVAWAALGVAPGTLEADRRSLLPDPARFGRLAARVGGALRQVAECGVQDGHSYAIVEPLVVARDGALARTRDEQNHVELHTGWSAPLSASGPGAGGLPTATSLLSDVLSTGSAANRPRPTLPSTRDTRPSTWALETNASPSDIHAEVRECGVVRTDADASCAWTIVSAATRDEIDDIIARLTARGGDVIAIRVDDGVAVSGSESHA